MYSSHGNPNRYSMNIEMGYLYFLEPGYNMR
jgi:hypothetical protein